MKKTILYFGDFRESYSTERYVAHALKELGYEVIAKQEGDFVIGNNVENIVNEIKGLDPLLVLFSKGAPAGRAEMFIDGLKTAGIPTATWLFDLYFDLPGADRLRKLKMRIPPYNVETIFSTDGGHEKQWEELGIKHKVLRQGIHEPEAILYDLPKTRDVIFVGADAFYTRAPMLEALKERYNFEWWGQNKNRIRGLPLNELYASSKVVVGDSQPSPKYWSNRVYETLGRGGFLLHPITEGLSEEFTDGVHMVFYERGNQKQLNALIDYYLKHDVEREKIRKSGFEHVKKNFTYKHRCIELIKNYE